MKTNRLSVAPFYLAGQGTSILARLVGAATVALASFISLSVHGATMISKAANAQVYIGLPWAELEFENPLAGTETVVGHAILDWRDADFSSGPPPWYDDWSVSGSTGGSLGGYEIYLLGPGASGWTTTTVPGSIVSIHLNGDNNDGIAQVLVDGTEVARLDMFYAGGAGGCCETAMVLVSGLANTTHTITVNDLGAGQGGGTDVHIMGAAVLKESPIKWNQPPVVATNVTSPNVFDGWNQPSMHSVPELAADDWVCTTTNPVTKIRWWGSFSNWTEPYPPTPISRFYFRFWHDVPAGVDAPFSHPTNMISAAMATNFSWTYVGQDYDPRTGMYEACFMYETVLDTNYWFYQQPGPTGTNIYWLSIEATLPVGIPFPWGWKTRPRDPNSAAPDGAVLSTNGFQLQPSWQPIWWPYPTNLWDLAFELISERTVAGTKWLQVPDLSTNGMDVNDTWFTGLNPPPPPPYILADDFLCTSQGYITNITIWGSWFNDQTVSVNTIFNVQILDDIPVSATNAFSKPGAPLWGAWYTWGNFHESVYASGIDEWWLTPPAPGIFPGDHTCYQYDFPLGSTEFRQQGTPQKPKVYWLCVQAQIPIPPDFTWIFGWKTSPTHWNDAAVWAMQNNPVGAPWTPLLYPPEHPRNGQNVDLAFRLDGQHIVSQIKWSQPPVRVTTLNTYNGWNEQSVFDQGQTIVADDWACTTTNPVTDIHWWGSFLNWSNLVPPQLPDAFQITFWLDVPAVPGDPLSFSHPGPLVGLLICTNFTWHLDGYDWDPRNPQNPLETCFKFDQELATNEWFYQDPASGTNIFWISIAAIYNPGPNVPYPWGWKTRPRDTDSLAPDDAVRFYFPGGPYNPIYWPEPTNSWDMAFVLTTRATEDQDFGDAPDLPYPTLLSSTGARHFILPGFNFGTLIDAETNGLPNANATGDDTNNVADEDGVSFLPPLLVGTQAWVNVTLTSLAGTGQLDAWVDFNKNGTWEAGEKVFNSLTLLSGVNSLSFNVPKNAVVGQTFARFRLSSVGALLPTGAAADGEVEDYRLTLMQRGPLATNIVITNFVTTVSNATVWWNAQTDIHYWLLGTTNVGIGLSNWSWVGSEVIGPVSNQVESYYYRYPTNRFYSVIAPYVWP